MATIAVWPDNVWCPKSELEEMLNPPFAKSDDYQLVNVPDDYEYDDVECFLRFKQGEVGCYESF